jgi:hypothetical protein
MVGVVPLDTLVRIVVVVAVLVVFSFILWNWKLVMLFR